ncbi:MAG: hypothetical protein AAGB13_06215 [Cyanobacteria bacterium P01_F01_bin.33]
MKSIRLVSAALSLAAFCGMAEIASAQVYDPWSNMMYDTSGCEYYNSCWVDQYGDVYGSNSYETQTYVHDGWNTYTPLSPDNNVYAPPSYSAPSYSATDTYVPYPNTDDSHQQFINSIWE